MWIFYDYLVVNCCPRIENGNEFELFEERGALSPNEERGVGSEEVSGKLFPREINMVMLRLK